MIHKLSRWLRDNKLSHAEFARRLGCDPSLPGRWLRGVSVPTPAMMVKIFILTNGDIVPNDFYELPRIRRGKPPAEVEDLPPVRSFNFDGVMLGFGCLPYPAGFKGNCLKSCDGDDDC